MIITCNIHIFPIISWLEKGEQKPPLQWVKLIDNAGFGTGPRGVGAAASYDSFVRVF
jgi:hypothetical protein